MGIASGQIEPTWIAADGALVYEDVQLTAPSGPTYAGPGTSLPPDIDRRYGNPGGSRPITGFLNPE